MREQLKKLVKNQKQDAKDAPNASTESESIEAQWLKRAEGGRHGGGGQRELSRKPLPEVPACLGFDFGTSCSKVVVQVQAPRFAVGIVFPEGEKHGLPCLLPTRLFVASDGRTAIDPIHGVAPVVEIKRSLMSRPNEELQLGTNRGLRACPVDLAAAYLGHALAFSRTTFVASSKGKLPEGAAVRWSANIGLPARSIDEAAVREAFLTAFKAGWALSAGNSRITLETSRAAVEAVRRGEAPAGIDPDQFHSIPEVTAEATGYARSNMRQYGTHLMVDVGATTLDACLFLLFDRDGEYGYSLLDADVDPKLGAIGLQERRMEEVATILSRANPFMEVADTVQKYLVDASKCKGLDLVDVPFTDDAVVMLQAVIARAKKKAHKDLTAYSDTHGGHTKEVDSRIRVILCGGGARLSLYREALRQVESRVRPGGASGLSVKPFEFIGVLPRPATLEMPQAMETHYDRLAVAYGLSFTVENVGHFIPPSHIHDAAPAKVRVRPDMTTKDMV